MADIITNLTQIRSFETCLIYITWKSHNIKENFFCKLRSVCSSGTNGIQIIILALEIYVPENGVEFMFFWRDFKDE